MKDILKQLVETFITIICCVVQIFALGFVGIGWIFNKTGDLLTDAVEIVIKKIDTERKKEKSKEVPLEG